MGIGVNATPAENERALLRHPNMDFRLADSQEPLSSEPFDYIIANNVVGHLDDVWTFFRKMHDYCGPETRVLVTYYNFLWEPILAFAELLRLKRSTKPQSWISLNDMINLLDLADFEVVSAGYRLPIPVGPRFLSSPLNKLLSLIPFLNKLGLICHATARPFPKKVTRKSNPSATIVIPTKDERGNIQGAIERLPEFTNEMEVIFVDGNSSDGTVEEINHQIERHPGKNIRLILQGDGKGKADAVRKGFAAATGDVFIILDADLTVPPEDLPKFWDAILREKGEFINGTRLVYPMEDQAMRLANILGNKIFSMLFSWILSQRITDTLCGTKVLWAHDYEKIVKTRPVFGEFDPFGDFDLLFGATYNRLKIREVPIRYRAREYGETSIARWRHGMLLIRMAAKGIRKFKLR